MESKKNSIEKKVKISRNWDIQNELHKITFSKAKFNSKVDKEVGIRSLVPSLKK